MRTASALIFCAIAATTWSGAVALAETPKPAIEAYHWGDKAKLGSGSISTYGDFAAKLEKSNLAIRVTPSLYGKAIGLPPASREVPTFFDQLISNNPGVRYFFLPGSKEVWMFDAVVDTRQASPIPVRLAHQASFEKALELACRTNADKLGSFEKGASTYLVAAPPQVASAIAEFASSLRQSAMREAMVFELHYANAVKDTVGTTINRSGDIVVPGVEDRLRKLFEFAAAGATDATLPTLVADKERNDIIIVDHPENRDRYEKIIKALDRQPEMVEITAAIIDIAVSSEFGWESHFELIGRERSGSDVRLAAGFGSSATADTSGFGFPDLIPADGLPPDALTQRTGLNAAAMIVGSNYQITSKIEALQSDGQAKVLFRPSLLAIDNHPARLTDTSTAYESVVGTRQAKLYKIEAGLDLGIIPRIVESPGSDGERPEQPRQIHLVIDIGDGDVEPSDPANLTTETNRLITQTVLRENESLLIGGRYRKLESERADRVPGIGRLRVLGAPFRSESREDVMLQRLYLVTPRIVGIGEARSEAELGAADAALIEAAARGQLGGEPEFANPQDTERQKTLRPRPLRRLVPKIFRRDSTE